MTSLYIILWLLCGLGTIFFICDFDSLKMYLDFKQYDKLFKMCGVCLLLLIFGPLAFVFVLIALFNFGRNK